MIDENDFVEEILNRAKVVLNRIFTQEMCEYLYNNIKKRKHPPIDTYMNFLSSNGYNSRKFYIIYNKKTRWFGLLFLMDVSTGCNVNKLYKTLKRVDKKLLLENDKIKIGKRMNKDLITEHIDKMIKDMGKNNNNEPSSISIIGCKDATIFTILI